MAAAYQVYILQNPAGRLYIGVTADARKLENLLKRQKGGDGFNKITGLSRQPKSGS